jgi:phosphoribosylformylglycinamidine synthase
MIGRQDPSEGSMYLVELIVKPRPGVYDPQGSAVEEALRNMGHQDLTVHYVGRYLSMDLAASSEAEARAKAEEMCRRLLVNPNLETYDLSVKARP